MDFQNSYEAAWMGCPLRYFGAGVPDTEPILSDCKDRLYDLAPPDPLRGGLLARAMDFFDYMHERCPEMKMFYDRFQILHQDLQSFWGIGPHRSISVCIGRPRICPFDKSLQTTNPPSEAPRR